MPAITDLGTTTSQLLRSLVIEQAETNRLQAETNRLLRTLIDRTSAPTEEDHDAPLTEETVLRVDDMPRGLLATTMVSIGGGDNQIIFGHAGRALQLSVRGSEASVVDVGPCTP